MEISVSMIQFLIQHSPLFYLIQPFWRDEAYSALFAQQSLYEIVTKSSFEPPVYYILLHFWIKILGESEIAIRSLSLLAFILACWVVIRWAEKLCNHHWVSWYMLVFFFLNPMLLYYACEARAYAWYTLFAVLSMYTYAEKRWRWYPIVTILGFYTHLYMIFVPFVQGTHYLFTHPGFLMRFHWRKFIADPMMKSMLLIGVSIAPWIFVITREMWKFKYSWYFPVDFHLLKSVLGNMFLGYEGTPWYLWTYTSVCSVILCFFFVLSLIPKSTRERNVPIFLLIFVPLSLIISVSFVKPLFVNRYFIFVSVAEVLLVCFSIYTIRNVLLQTAVAGVFLAGIIAFNIWYPLQHRKLDLRTPIADAQLLMGSNDLLFADDTLVFLETLYYAKDKQRVFLYNPSGSPFPPYVGDAVVKPHHMVKDYPTYPQRAFVIHNDATYSVIYNYPIQIQTPHVRR